ncbi:MAG: Sca4 family protein, partial [Rickettsiaceae bacterium]|nr:Sca4 family protein [Rickettsiaceae bacterium]
KLLAKGIEPAEETTKQRRDNSLENVTSLEKALHTAYEDNPKALKKFREVPLFDQEQLKGLYKEPVTIHIEEQLDVLKAAEKRLKSKLQETRKEHYIKSDEHVSAQTRLAEAQLQAELDLREVTSKRDSLRAEMKNLETEFLGLEAKREEIQKSITTQEAIIKGLEQTVEIEQWQAAEKPLSIKQQIKLNKEKMALVDNFNKSLSELSPEVIKHQKASLELQARELQEKNQLIERLQSELIGINAELHKKEGQQLGEGTSLAEQLQETSEIEGLRQQLQAKDQENGALKAQLLEAETAHKSEVEGLQTQLTSARSEASELQAQITFNAEALASLKSENTATQSASKEKLATLQAELASAQLSGSEQVTSLQQQLDALTASNTEQLAQHKAAETEAQLQLASLKTEHASALQTAKEAASQVESAHKERVAELKKQITTAKQNEQEAQSSLAATKLELSALQSEQSTLGEELEAAQQSLKSGKGNKLELESQIAQLEQTIKDNTASITELQQEQSAKEAVHKEAVEQHQEQLQAKDQENGALKAQLLEAETAHKSEVEGLQTQLTSARSEASELQAQITFNAEALASLKSENTATQSASKEKLATLQAELASAQLSGSEQVTSLQQQLDALTASNTEQLAQHKAAETEAQLQLASLKTEHASALQTAKEAASQVESAHKERVAELKKQITTAKQNEQEAQSSLAATKLELSALQSEQSTLGEELEAAQQSLKSGKGNKLELESQIAQLEQTIKDNTASITELQQEQSAKEAVHKEAVAQTKAIHLAEVQELQSQLTVAKLIKEDNVERLAASKASIKQLTQEKSALSKELALVKTQSLKRKDNGSVDKELEARIRHLTELSRKNTEELEKLKQQKPSQQKDVDKSTQSVAAVEARLKLSAQQAEEITEIVQQPIAKEKITDKVAITSDDQILNDFRELKKMQYDTIHGILTNIPHGIEAFHDYAAKNGNEIGEFMTHSEGAVNLLADIEREKYKEIHNKYAYEDIEWNDRNQASITKDGIEICKLGNQKTKEEGHEYSLNDKIISNYRNLDVPLKTEEGPVHMSFVVRDLQGKNISAKEAVYLTAHYDKKGKLVEMTTPVPVYYTGTDKESPICIKQNGKIYTLPVNRGKYEEMMQEIAINKGLHKDKVTHKSQNTGQAMDYISTAKNIGKTVSKAPLKSTVVALPKSQRRNVKEQTR